MIVTCPGCASKYRVRNEAVPAEGARMRCPKCETLFLAKPPAGGEASDDGAAGLPAASPFGGPGFAPPPQTGLSSSSLPGLAPPAPTSPPQAAPGFGQPPPGFGQAPPGFGQPGAGQAPGFGTAPPTGAFGALQPPSQQSPFGAAPSPFGASPAPFGAPSPSPFGAPPSPSPFGGQAPAPSPFGAAPSPFGAAPSPFGASPAPFGAPSPSPFGAPSQPPSPSPFGAQPGTGFGPAPAAPATTGPLTAMMRTFDPSAPPPSGMSGSSSMPPAPSGDDDPFARLNIDARQDPGLNVPTIERLRPTPPPPRPAPTQAPLSSTTTSTAAPAKLARPPKEYRPPSRAMEAASWVFVGLGAISAVGGVVFAAWTSEAIDLDATLMPIVEEKLGVHPPRSFIGRDDVEIDVLRREAMAKESAGDLPAAAVLWRRVIARDDADATAKTALPRVMTALGERLR